MDGGAVGVIISASGAGVSFLASALIVAFKMGKQSETIKNQGQKIDTCIDDVHKLDKKVDKHGETLVALDTKMEGVCNRTLRTEERINGLMGSET